MAKKAVVSLVCGWSNTIQFFSDSPGGLLGEMTFSRRNILGVLIVLAVGSVVAAADADQQIETFPNRWLHAKLLAGAQPMSIKISSQKFGQEIRWQPNVHSLTGVSLAFRDFITLGVSAKSGFEEGALDRRGRTDYSDYRLGISYKNFFATLNYQDYRGFFVANSENVQPGSTANGREIQDNGLLFQNHGINLMVVSDPKTYSFRAANSQTERQNKMGGSWLLGLDAHSTKIQSSNGLIPAGAQGNYGEDRLIRELVVNSLRIKAGGAYTLALQQKLYLTGLITIGFGPNFVRFNLPSESFESTDTGAKTDLLLGLGFNGDEHLFGLHIKNDSNQTNTRSLTVMTELTEFFLFYGMRF